MVMTGMGTGREKKKKNRRAIFSTMKTQFHSLLKLRKVEKKKKSNSGKNLVAHPCNDIVDAYFWNRLLTIDKLRTIVESNSSHWISFHLTEESHRKILLHDSRELPVSHSEELNNRSI